MILYTILTVFARKPAHFFVTSIHLIENRIFFVIFAQHLSSALSFLFYRIALKRQKDRYPSRKYLSFLFNILPYTVYKRLSWSYIYSIITFRSATSGLSCFIRFVIMVSAERLALSMYLGSDMNAV